LQQAENKSFCTDVFGKFFFLRSRTGAAKALTEVNRHFPAVIKQKNFSGQKIFLNSIRLSAGLPAPHLL
jgi:hypothetical protein